MKRDFVILGDTTCDLGEEIRKKYNIEYIYSHIIYPDGKERIATLNWQDYTYFGANCTSDIFYSELKRNPEGYKTSPANIDEVAQIFEKYVLQGKDVLYVCLSSGMSGAYYFSVKAKELVLSKYPDAKIFCIDSLRFCSGLGLMLVHASIMRSEGKSIEEVYDYLEKNKCRFHQMGWLDDLSFVSKKGRVTPTKAFFGSLIGVKVLGEFDYNGLTTPIGKTKGEKAAFDAILGYIEKTIENPSDQIIFISESNRSDKAELFKSLLNEKFHPREIVINKVFPPCGINVGPGLLSAYYIGKPINKGLVEEKALIESLLNKKNPNTKIKKVDGTLFESMIRFSLKNLMFFEEEINRINVFPVSDGDTGTNMRITLENGINASNSSEILGEYLKALSKGMLLGARGNSGVILSQFFKGIYLYLKEKRKTTIEDFAKAFYEGSKVAYESVIRPVEGTILTVSSEGILSILSKINRETDLLTFLELYLDSLCEALKKTPDSLPVLKSNGVVDSGGTGLLRIVEGMKKYLTNESIELSKALCSKEVKIQEIDKSKAFTKDSSFILGYCMEFVLQVLEAKCGVGQINIQDIVQKLTPMGECLVAVQEESIIKVHIHVQNPVPVLAYILNFGEFISFKLENMQLQHNQLYLEEKKCH